ncbi:DCC1-like thiol-disulfide oxidoreductase family protein, partial [Mycobacteroides abscessus]
MNEQAPVLLYDGVCALCNGAVKKILRDDKVGSMRFAALDSEYGTQVIDRHP